MKHRFVTTAVIALAAAPFAWAQQWTAPVGIPMPPIGVTESHTMYAGQAGYQDAGNGPYTHYVDSSRSCSDSGSGTATQPRCTIPTSLSAGDVVEVHGGPYSPGGQTSISSNGTEARPAFLRGVDDGRGFPVIRNTDIVDFNGTYLVVENFVFDGIYVRTGEASASFVALRNLEIKNHPSKNGTRLHGRNIVLLGSHIHHHQGNDRHGTMVSSGSNGVWILENHYHHNGGDAIQLCHGCSANPPSNVYIGRNDMHGDRENGVDLKYARNIVVSENKIHGYRESNADQQWCFDDGSSCGVFSSGSDGAAAVIGSDGGPENVWFLLNDIYDAEAGIRIEEGYDVWLIGNRIHGIVGDNRRGIRLEKTGRPLHIAHNTISDVGYGIDQDWRDDFTVFLNNNLFSNVANAYIRFESRNVGDAAEVRNNLFWRNGGSISLVWGSAQTASSSAQLDSIMGGTGNIIGDPRFVNEAGGDFRLRAGSAAIDAGNAELAQYDSIFRQRFPGATLLRDPDGKTRPLNGGGSGGAAYDIGAYEFGGGSAAAPPRPPSGLTVQ